MRGGPLARPPRGPRPAAAAGGDHATRPHPARPASPPPPATARPATASRAVASVAAHAAGRGATLDGGAAPPPALLAQRRALLEEALAVTAVAEVRVEVVAIGCPGARMVRAGAAAPRRATRRGAPAARRPPARRGKDSGKSYAPPGWSRPPNCRAPTPPPSNPYPQLAAESLARASRAARSASGADAGSSAAVKPARGKLTAPRRARAKPAADGAPAAAGDKPAKRSRAVAPTARPRRAKAAAPEAAAAPAPAPRVAATGAAAVASLRATAGSPRRRVRRDPSPGPAARSPSRAPDPLSLFALRAPALAKPVPPEAANSDEAADLALLRTLDARLRRGRDARSAPRGGVAVGDAVTGFLKTLGHTGVLSREAEARLAAIIGKGGAAAAASDALATALGRAPTAAEVAARLGLAGGPAHLQLLLDNRLAAHDLMAQFNLRLVVHTAKRYTGLGLEMADLVAEGVAGLARAIDKFEPARGNRFSTYAMWWIRQAVTRSISEQSRVVHLPVHIYEAVTRIRRAKHALKEEPETEREMHKAVSTVTGLPVDKVERYLAAARVARSLDALVPSSGKGGADGGDAMSELLPCAAADGAAAARDADARDDVLRRHMDGVLASLPPRERNVLRMRYGLGAPGGRTMTLSDISAAYGVTTERIRQIEDSGLRRLREPDRAAGVARVTAMLAECE